MVQRRQVLYAGERGMCGLGAVDGQRCCHCQLQCFLCCAIARVSKRGPCCVGADAHALAGDTASKAWRCHALVHN
jgi:hypothetical protein